jgi:hypothetical protein
VSNEDDINTQFEGLTEIGEISASPLSVFVDWNQLVERHGGKVKKAYDEITKLKDLLS